MNFSTLHRILVLMQNVGKIDAFVSLKQMQNMVFHVEPIQ